MDQLGPGARLGVGGGLVSPSGSHRLTLCEGGDLVLCRADGHRLWRSDTADLPPPDRPTALAVRADGDVVLTGERGPRWSAGTAGAGPDVRLVVGDDGSLVVRTDAGPPVWAADSHSGVGVEFETVASPGPDRRIAVLGVVGVDGVLRADVATHNRCTDHAFRARALAVVLDAARRPVWVSAVFSATVRHPLGREGSCDGQEPWVEPFPAAVGRHAAAVEVRLGEAGAGQPSLQRSRSSIVGELLEARSEARSQARYEPPPDLRRAWDYLVE